MSLRRFYASNEKNIPGWMEIPRDKNERAFVEFHENNPHIYRELEKRALRLRRNGARRIGIAMIYESMRYDALVRSDSRDYKLNNNYRSLYARLLIHRHPSLAKVIETRRRK